MNKVILMGRLTRNPEVRYSAGDSSMAIARYTLAVDRRFTRRGEDNNGATADLSPVWLSDAVLSSLRSIFIRE